MNTPKSSSEVEDLKNELNKLVAIKDKIRREHAKLHEIEKSVSGKIRRLRQKRLVAMTDIQIAAECARSSISKMENYDPHISTDMIIRIASALLWILNPKD